MKVNIDYNWMENKDKPETTDDEGKIQKTIFLKHDRLREDLIAYIRSNLMNEKAKKNKD